MKPFYGRAWPAEHCLQKVQVNPPRSSFARPGTRYSTADRRM